MRQTRFLLGCGFSALALLSSCNSNSSLIYIGSSAEKPEVATVENSNNYLTIDYCNGYSTVNLDINHSDTIHILGWAYDSNNNAPLSQLIICANSKYIAVNYGLERQDVQAATNNSSSALGFEVSFSKALLQDENGYMADHLEFIGVTPSGQFAPISCNFIKEPTLPNVPVHEKNYEIAEGGICVDNANANQAIDVSAVTTPTTLIYGWAFDSETKSHLSNVYAKFGNHTLVATPKERPDVQQAFGLNDSQIGFSFEIPTALIKDPSVTTFEIIGVGTNGEYIFTPKKYEVVNAK